MGKLTFVLSMLVMCGLSVFFMLAALYHLWPYNTYSACMDALYHVFLMLVTVGAWVGMARMTYGRP